MALFLFFPAKVPVQEPLEKRRVRFKAFLERGEKPRVPVGGRLKRRFGKFPVYLRMIGQKVNVHEADILKGQVKHVAEFGNLFPDVL
jgi:hypothetical protein